MTNPHLSPPLTSDSNNDEKIRRNSCCSYCKHQQYQETGDYLNPLELKTLSLTPPLDNVYYYDQQIQPFSCIYLSNLFLAPDTTRYLKETPISDDIFDLPCFHLQKLVCEARMEVLLQVDKKRLATITTTALKRLEKLHSYITTVAHGDTEEIIKTLNELIHDDDELLNVLQE
jgi:hypothetical protein